MSEKKHVEKNLTKAEKLALLRKKMTLGALPENACKHCGKAPNDDNDEDYTSGTARGPAQ